MRDETLSQVSGYYERLINWYNNGGFTDEYGVVHKSGHYMNISHWEVLNEIDSEHSMTPEVRKLDLFCFVSLFT